MRPAAHLQDLFNATMERDNGRNSQGQLARTRNPLFDLRNEIDTLFDRFFSTSLLAPFGGRLMEAQPLRQFGGALPKGRRLGVGSVKFRSWLNFQG